MPQIARRHAVGIGQPPVRACVKIEAGDEVEQATVGTVRDRDRQRFFIEGVDIAANDGIQQPAQSALLRIAPADIIEVLLKSAESPQAVVLLRKPRMQVVHKSLFKWEKKLPVYTPGEGPGQMLFSQMSAANYATRERFGSSELLPRSRRLSFPLPLAGEADALARARRVGECLNRRRVCGGTPTPA